MPFTFKRNILNGDFRFIQEKFSAEFRGDKLFLHYFTQSELWKKYNIKAEKIFRVLHARARPKFGDLNIK